MSGAGSWTPPDAPREVVDRCAVCGGEMELVVTPGSIVERCTPAHHVAHFQLCYPEAFAEG